MRTLALAVVLAFACSKKTSDAPASDRPPSVDDNMLAIAGRYMDYMNKLANDFAATGGDCKKALAVVNATAEAAKALKADAESTMEKMRNDRAAQDWFDKRYSADMRAAITKLKPIVDACMKDPEFATALEQSSILPRKKRAASPQPAPSGP
jgi:hypothetical protein